MIVVALGNASNPVCGHTNSENSGRINFENSGHRCGSPVSDDIVVGNVDHPPSLFPTFDRISLDHRRENCLHNNQTTMKMIVQT